MAYNNLGNVLAKQGKLAEAIKHFRQAVQIEPGNAEAHSNLGVAFQLQGKLDDAITHLTKALELNPNFVSIHVELGEIFVRKGSFDLAVTQFTEALRLELGSAKVHHNLGLSLARMGKLVQATTHFERAMHLDPNSALLHCDLAKALAQTDKTQKAITHYKKSLELKPDWIRPMNTLAWLLATHKETELQNPKEAVRLAQRACELTDYNNTALLDTLAAAYAADGRFSDAVATAEKTLELARSLQQVKAAEEIQKRLLLYKSRFRWISFASFSSSEAWAMLTAFSALLIALSNSPSSAYAAAKVSKVVATL